MTNEELLKVTNLCVNIDSNIGKINALRNISFSLSKNQTLGIIGESGCGKSILAKAICQLLPKNAHIDNGDICIENISLLKLSNAQMRSYRGKVISIVFQNPMLALNPLLPVGLQITEAILNSQNISQKKAKKTALDLMSLVNIDYPEKRFYLKPHCFSGGMLQRIVIAIAIAQKPKILIADEAITALDAITKKNIIQLLYNLKQQLSLGLIFISHDLGSLAGIADNIAVMYAGKIIELGTAHDIFYYPAHPYTQALLKTYPAPLKNSSYRLNTISGIAPISINLPNGDDFAPRNPKALNIDFKETPPYFKISSTHFVASWIYDKRAPLSLKPAWLIDKGVY